MTLVAMISAWLATVQGRASLGAYLVTGYALAMLLNVLFPHVVASLALRRYMPGTATAVLLNLPVTIGLLLRAFREGYVETACLSDLWTNGCHRYRWVHSASVLDGS
jgi:hypothetical protein